MDLRDLDLELKARRSVAEIAEMRNRCSAMHPRRPRGFIEPCQPKAADKPPSGRSAGR
jgi:hypothetical protein